MLEPCSWQRDALPSGSIVRRRIIFPAASDPAQHHHLLCAIQWCIAHRKTHRVAGATASASRDSQQYDRRCTAREVCDLGCATEDLHTIPVHGG